jgi:photosystem II stability/assembly factor-like uncharacterized protein
MSDASPQPGAAPKARFEGVKNTAGSLASGIRARGVGITRGILTLLVLAAIASAALYARAELREAPRTDPFRPTTDARLIKGVRRNAFLPAMVIGSDLRVVTAAGTHPDSQVIWIGGSGAFLASSDDGGRSWRRAEITSGLPDESAGRLPTITDIVFPENAVFGIAVDDQGGRLETRNGGSSWTRTQKRMRTGLRSVGVVDRVFLGQDTEVQLGPVLSDTLVPLEMSWVEWLDQATAIGIDVSGRVRQTLDAGVTWHVPAVEPNVAERLSGLRAAGIVAAAPARVWVWFDQPDDGSLVVAVSRTKQGNLEWTPSDSLPYTLNAMQASSDTSGWAVTTDGRILSTHNLWKSASLSSLEPGLPLHDVYFVTPTQGWAIGEQGTLLRSTNGGDTWELVTGSADRLRGASFVSRRRGWAVGGWGTVLRTKDAGRSWRPQESGIRRELRDVRGIDENRAVAVGRNGAIIRTEDTGKTWVEGKIGGLPPRANDHYPELNSVFFRDAQVGWAVGGTVGGRGVVLRTDDGGRMWGQGADALTGHLTDVYFPEIRNGWITSDSGFIYASTDGGLTWRPEYRAPAGIRAVHAIGDRAWAVGDGGLILRRDSGTWKSARAPVRRTLNAVVFVSADTGWAAGTDGTVLRSTDGGLSWQVVPPVEGVDLYDLASAPRGRVWAVGAGGMVLRSDDGAVMRRVATKGSLQPGRRAAALVIGIAVFAWLVAVGGARWGPRYVVRNSISDALANDQPLDGTDGRVNQRLLPYAKVVSRFLRNRDTSPPLTLAIRGKWGFGKTSLMNLIREDMHEEGARTVTFNAWKHQQEDHLLAALLETVRDEGVPSVFRNPSKAVKFRRRLFWRRIGQNRPVAVGALLLVVAYLVFLFGSDAGAEFREGFALLAPEFCTGIASCTQFTIAQLSGSAVSLALLGGALLTLIQSVKSFAVLPGSILAKLGELTRIRSLAVETSVRQRFEREFGDVTAALGDNKLVIFVDDLDRCRPKHVLAVLEAIYFLVNSGRCIVVLGMDTERIVRAVAASFGEDAEHVWLAEDADAVHGTEGGRGSSPAESRRLDYARAYLGKLINFQIPLPPADQVQVSQFFDARVHVPNGRTVRAHWHRAKGWLVTAMLVLIAAWGTYSVFSAPAPELQRAPAVPASTIATAYVRPTTEPAVPSLVASTQLTQSQENSPAATVGPAAISGEGPAAVEVLEETGRTWMWFLRLVMAGVVIGALYSLRRGSPVVEDSDEFRDAVRLWSPYLARRYKSPRSAKKFVNRLRYYAMSTRTPVNVEWWKELLPFLRKETRYEEKPRIRDAELVALAALHDCDPALFRKASTYTHFRTTIERCLGRFTIPDLKKSLDALGYDENLQVGSPDGRVWTPVDEFLRIQNGMRIKVSPTARAAGQPAK